MAPGSQGATTEHIRAYVREEQRREPGCPAREPCDASRFQRTRPGIRDRIACGFTLRIARSGPRQVTHGALLRVTCATRRIIRLWLPTLHGRHQPSCGAASHRGIRGRARARRCHQLRRGGSQDPRGDLRDPRLGARRALDGRPRGRRPALRADLDRVVRARFPSSTPSAAQRRSRAASVCRAASGPRGEPAWIPDVVQRRELSRAPRSPRAKACTPRSASPCCCAARSSASWSSSAARSASRTRACCRCSRPSAIRSGCSSIGGGRRRSSIASSRCRSTCCASRASTATSSGVNPAWQRILGYDRSRAAVASVSGFRPSRRPRGDARRGARSSTQGGRGHLLREPLSPQGRHAALAALDARRRFRSSRSSTPPRATSPSERRPRRRWRSTRATSRWPTTSSRIRPSRLAQLVKELEARQAPRRRSRPRPRARSWPT